MKKQFAFLSFLFYANFAFGEYITSNIVNGCNNDLSDDETLYANFVPNKHTCSTGYYLPANTDGCRTCLSGYDCNGGTFAFNETLSQGIYYKKNLDENVVNGCNNSLLNVEILYATFIPNEHSCSAGYYLPAGVDACTLCPANSACAGGTYSFNETTDQGIVACASGTFAPSGSAVCYQHILHVGNDNVYLRSTKQTTPSLNIQIGNDIFYANMTTTPTYMNKDSTHYLHILYEGDDYYVCDDTTYQE